MADEALVPVVPKEVVIQRADGKTSIAMRGEGGKFAKKAKTVPSSRELTRWGRTLLGQAEAGDDGKIVKGSKTRHRKIFDNLVRIAGLESTDPKIMMASVKAFEVLYRRFYGKEAVSDEELDAAKQQGVKFVIFAAPQLANNEPKPEVKPPTQPSFITGEMIQRN